MSLAGLHRVLPAEIAASAADDVPTLAADDELTELLAQLLERAWRRRHGQEAPR